MRRRELRPLLPGDGRGGQGRWSPRSATTAPRTWSAATTCSSRSPITTTIDLAPLITPLEEFLDLEPLDLPVADGGARRGARRGGSGRRPADPHGGQAGLGADRRPGRRQSARRPRDPQRVPARRPTPTTACSAPSWPGRSPARGSSTTGPRAPTTTCSPASSFNGGSRRRPGLRRLQRLRASRSGSRAAPRTASARRCWAAPSSILKGKGAKGKRLNGSVGKSFAYGAQRGRLFVQGSADSRFCIRLSGADVVLGRRAARSRSTTAAAASSTAPTPRASPSST